MRAFIDRDKSVLLQIYDTQELLFTRAEGMYLIDNEGKRYLDYSAQYSACSLGHGNTEMIDAIAEQMRKIVSVTAMFVTEERVQLAETLAGLAPCGLNKVIFGCTGSDAIELALKIAKYYRGGGRILSFRRGFHGSTAGSAAATGKAETIQEESSISELLPRGFIRTPAPYCYRCDFDKEPATCEHFCLSFLEQTILHEAGDKLAAVIVEPILASGGVLVPPEGYMKRLREICDHYGALLIFDEVVTGFGRTGRLFATEWTGVTPDILVIGKALTGGYIPGSAVLMRQDIGEKMDGLTLHGHTHSCYPGTCVAALKNIEIIARDGLVQQAGDVGSYLYQQLIVLQRKHPEIGDVRGKGLLQGFELVEDRESKKAHHQLAARLFRTMLRNGLVTEVESRRNLQNAVIVLHPPLITTKAHVDEAIEIIDRSLTECTMGGL